MSVPDFERAKNYARDRLERDLPSNLFYHSLSHTKDDVVPAAERLATLEGIEGEPLILVRTAAWFHDIGFVEQPTDNEIIAVRIAGEVLPSMGYGASQIEVISGLIMATRLPQTPHTGLEEIMSDADLDVFGQEEFLVKNRALRTELAANGKTFTDHDWYSGQLKMMRDHQYFTSAARQLHHHAKARNIALMEDLLQQAQR